MINLPAPVSPTARTHGRRLFVDNSLRTLLIFSGLLLTACATPTGISQQVLKPAKEGAMSKARNLAIVNFSGDRRGLFVDRLESMLAGVKVNGKNYFTLLARDMLDVIINEQRMINETGLFKQSDAVRLGQLSGADTIISGSVARPRYETTRFKENRSKCTRRKKDKDGDDAGCANWRDYQVRCTTQTSYDEFNFRAVDVTRGEILFAKNYSDQASHSYCSDSGAMYTRTDLETLARTSTMQQLRLDVAPYAVNVFIEFMTKDKSKMPQSAKNLLKHGLEFAESGRLGRACENFREAVSSFEQSPALYHNLGVCAEVSGDFDRALTFFKKADFLSTRPEELIGEALRRVPASINRRSKVAEQLR